MYQRLSAEKREIAINIVLEGKGSEEAINHAAHVVNVVPRTIKRYMAIFHNTCRIAPLPMVGVNLSSPLLIRKRLSIWSSRTTSAHVAPSKDFSTRNV